MRIEINSGGLFGTSVQDFAKAYDKMYKRNREVTRQFKIVRANVATMNGGIGNLQNAYDSLSARINKTEYDRQKSMEKKGDKFAAFLNNTEKTDKDVAKALKLENIRFVIKNPWAAEKSLKEKFWSGMDSVGHWLGDRADDIDRWCSRKAHSIANFMREHADALKKIAIGVGFIALIAGAAAATIATGGAAAPFLVAALKGAVVFALAGAATSTLVSAAIEKKSAGEVFDDAADGFMRGAFVGAAWAAMAGIAGFVSGAVAKVFVSSGLDAAAAQVGTKLLGSLGNLVLKTGGYFAANVAGEGASYLATGKGFEDGFLMQAFGKSIIMGGTDALFSIFIRTGFAVAGKDLPFSALKIESWSNVLLGLGLPSAGGILGGIALDDSNRSFWSKAGYGIAGAYGSTAAPSENKTENTANIYIKTPGQQLQNPKRIDFLKNSINNNISRRFANSEINRASLLTRQRINKRFSYFTGGSYRQCLVAGACY